jgi:hypothetical protein
LGCIFDQLAHFLGLTGQKLTLPLHIEDGGATLLEGLAALGELSGGQAGFPGEGLFDEGLKEVGQGVAMKDRLRRLYQLRSELF